MIPISILYYLFSVAGRAISLDSPIADRLLFPNSPRSISSSRQCLSESFMPWLLHMALPKMSRKISGAFKYYTKLPGL